MEIAVKPVGARDARNKLHTPPANGRNGDAASKANGTVITPDCNAAAKTLAWKHYFVPEGIMIKIISNYYGTSKRGSPSIRITPPFATPNSISRT